METSKKFVSLGVVVSAISCSAGVAADSIEDDQLLHEYVNNKLVEKGIDTGFSFSGDLNFTQTFINQSIDDGFDNAAASLQGNVNLLYSARATSCGYGFEVGAKTNSGIIKQGNAIVEVAYVFVDSKYGQFKFGHTNTAADSFNICGDACLVGYQGFGSGNFRSFYNVSTGAIVDSGCPFDDGKATKIVWLSPVVAGWSCGVSYTFDSDDSTLFKTIHQRMDGSHNGKECSCCASSKNIVTFGVAYEYGDPDGFNTKLSASIWGGKGESKSEHIHIRNLRAFNLGALLNYKNFKMALGYTDNGKSFLSTQYATAAIDSLDINGAVDIRDPRVGLMQKANSGKIYSVGMAYAFGKLAASVGLLRGETKFSDTEKAKSTVVSVATEYTVNRTFSVYAEYDNIITRTCKRARAYAKACDPSTNIDDNRANMVMVGMKANL